MTDYYWTINGNRWVHVDGKIHQDYLTARQYLEGLRKTPAHIYLENLGFSCDEAEEYLDGLLPKEN
jgi:hypothetical protein